MNKYGLFLSITSAFLFCHPAQAALLSFEFSFLDEATSTPVSGEFIFDNSITGVPAADPNLGVLYPEAVESFSITAGSENFQGENISLVVADNNVSPMGTFDVIIFDDFEDFDPMNPTATTFAGTFLYPQDTFDSNEPPVSVPPTAFSIISPEEPTFSGAGSTQIVPVPETSTSPAIFLFLAITGGIFLSRR